MAIEKDRLGDLLAGHDPKAVFSKDGLFDELKKAVAERVLNAESDDHLDTEGTEGSRNRRNGYSKKTVLTETAKIDVRIPRDREGTFDPKLIQRYQRRFRRFRRQDRVDVGSGMTVREIEGHLLELYGPEVSPNLISTVTGAVLETVAEWRNRPLETSYPLVFFDAIRVKIRDEGLVRNKAVYLALGVAADGAKDILGLWIETTEGAKFWLKVMNDLKAWRSRIFSSPLQTSLRSLRKLDCDGLKGFPEAIEAVFPQAAVQTCIVHLIRNSLDFVSWKDREPVVAELRKIYRAADAKAGRKALEAFKESPGGRKYAAIGQIWRRQREQITPFFAFAPAVRKIIYTTNAIEALNVKLRRAGRARGHLPNDEAAMKLIFLVLRQVVQEWKMPPREWAEAKTQFAIMFGERFVRA